MPLVVLSGVEAAPAVLPVNDGLTWPRTRSQLGLASSFLPTPRRVCWFARWISGRGKPNWTPMAWTRDPSAPRAWAWEPLGAKPRLDQPAASPRPSLTPSPVVVLAANGQSHAERAGGQGFLGNPSLPALSKDLCRLDQSLLNPCFETPGLEMQCLQHPGPSNCWRPFFIDLVAGLLEGGLLSAPRPPLAPAADGADPC